MRKLLVLLSFAFISFSAQANYYTPIQANFWYSSQTSCYAETQCPDGRVIWCQTYATTNGGYNNVNQCQFRVNPGSFVQCVGYAQQTDYYGRVYWAHMNIPVSCY